jgi:CRISPR/Cas system CSM-associated protein Csm3 (group 7 of RAMP superfamily)
MPTSSTKGQRRSTADILAMLADQAVKGYSASEFCSRHRVSKQTYYNWQQKYGSGQSLTPGFVPLNVPVSQADGPVPFCEITTSDATSIRFYQPVHAKFIKALNLF